MTRYSRRVATDFNIYTVVAYGLATSTHFSDKAKLPVGAALELDVIERIRQALPETATIGDIARAYLARRLAYLKALGAPGDAVQPPTESSFPLLGHGEG